MPNLFPNLAGVPIQQIAECFGLTNPSYHSLVVAKRISGSYLATLDTHQEFLEVLEDIGITKVIHQKRIKIDLEGLTSFQSQNQFSQTSSSSTRKTPRVMPVPKTFRFVVDLMIPYTIMILATCMLLSLILSSPNHLGPSSPGSSFIGDALWNQVNRWMISTPSLPIPISESNFSSLTVSFSPSPPISLSPPIDVLSKWRVKGMEITGTFGSKGTGEGKFQFPFAITHGVGLLFISDSGNHRVTVHNEDGSFLRSIGHSGWGSGELRRPYGITYHHPLLYVADSGNDRISCFSPDGTPRMVFGSYGAGPGHLNSPNYIITHNNKVYVTEGSNNRVSIFSLTGKFITSFGSYGVGPGKFDNPMGMAIINDSLYIVDNGNNRICTHRPDDGSFISSSFGSIENLGSLTPLGDLLIVREYSISIFDKEGDRLYNFGSYLSGPDRIQGPGGMVYFNDTIYAVEKWNHRIVTVKHI